MTDKCRHNTLELRATGQLIQCTDCSKIWLHKDRGTYKHEIIAGGGQ